MSLRDTIGKLNKFENECYDLGIIVQQRISNQGTGDARALTFYKLATLIRTYKTYFILKNEYLQNRKRYYDIYIKEYGQSWPRSIKVNGNNNEDILEHNDHNQLNAASDYVMLVGFIQTLFSITESRFRLFVVEMNPNACNNGRDSFSNIYTYLLSEIKKRRHKGMLDIFRFVRNSIHNNGVYLAKNEDDPKVRSLTYKGITYSFEDRKVTDYKRHSFELIFYEITPGVINMFKDIILNSPEILNISYIADPLA